MKANNLMGEYCQTCASLLDDVQRNHRRIIVLDSQCLAVFQQSGDASRLDEQANLQGIKVDTTENPPPAFEHEIPEEEPDPKHVAKRPVHKAHGRKK